MTFRPRNFVVPALSVAGLLACCVLPGCTSLLAQRAITNFAESLESQDFDQLKATTSDNFEAKALRQPEALRDLKMLRVPQGDVKIVEVEEIDDETKKATVQIGKDEETAKTVEYTLSLDSVTGRWVVDDLVIGQKDERGREVKRSVTEQMDLLLSCREFLDDWHDAPRAVKLEHCTKELQDELASLPPVWLDGLILELVGSDRRKSFRPDARLNGEMAVVRVPHEDGDLFIEFHQVSDDWKVQNLAIEPKDKESTGVRSLIKLARSLNMSANFLTTFASGDEIEIQKFATPDFYSRCLASGEFERIPLPISELIAAKYESNQYKDRSELVLDADGKTYMVTLRHVDLEDSDGKIIEGETRIDEVTIFEPGGAVKKFSAMLLSKSVVNLFVESLRERNIRQLKQLSSNDFNERVWSRDVARHFVILPYPTLGNSEPKVFATAYHGDVTDISVEIDDVPMTFVLLLSDDMMVIDDVIIPDYQHLTSLKSNLELMLPIYEFASAIHQQDLETLAKHSASSLNRMVWQQLNHVPELSRELIRPMMSEVISIQVEKDWTTVTTSDGVTSAEIHLVSDGKLYRIHDVVLKSETDPDLKMAYLSTVRKMISEGTLLPAGAKQPRVMQANRPKATPLQTTSASRFEPISPAVYHRESPENP